jgi:UV DNA damage endonuclease
MIRFGLCCIFRSEPIKFRRTTVRYLKGMLRKAQLQHVAGIIRHNAEALMAALIFCHENNIGAFRINSQILPVKTHPETGYAMDQLPRHQQIVELFQKCGAYSRKHDIRTSFHPDQFIVLNSPDPGVVQRSIADLAYHAEVAHWVNADVINLHAGGGYGNKKTALQRLTQQIEKLPSTIRQRLTLENDDRIFSPRDLLPVCRHTGVPLVYDIHHHRCLPDGVDEQTTTAQALATWAREPHFHISSPLNPWGTGDARPHHDFIDPADFPCAWKDLDCTVDIEAKAKEAAIARLQRQLPWELGSRCG